MSRRDDYHLLNGLFGNGASSGTGHYRWRSRLSRQGSANPTRPPSHLPGPHDSRGFVVSAAFLAVCGITIMAIDIPIRSATAPSSGRQAALVISLHHEGRSPQLRGWMPAASLQSARSNQIVIVINLVCEQAHPSRDGFVRRMNSRPRKSKAWSVARCAARTTSCASLRHLYLNSGASPSAIPRARPGIRHRRPCPAGDRFFRPCATSRPVPKTSASSSRPKSGGCTTARPRSAACAARPRAELEELLEEGIGVLPVPPTEDPLH